MANTRLHRMRREAGVRSAAEFADEAGIGRARWLAAERDGRDSLTPQEKSRAMALLLPTERMFDALL